jgi:hypothetical protein
MLLSLSDANINPKPLLAPKLRHFLKAPFKSGLSAADISLGWAE